VIHENPCKLATGELLSNEVILLKSDSDFGTLKFNKYYKEIEKLYIVIFKIVVKGIIIFIVRYTISKRKGRQKMDIKFEKDGYKFNVRSSCIIKDKEHKKIVLTNMRAITDHQAYLLPGGRLNLLENSQDAILREIAEELDIKLDCQLISIEENIVKKTKFHMIEFVYYAEIESFDIFKRLDEGWDSFGIFNISEIDDVDIRPKSIIALIKQEEYKQLKHNINYDWL